MSSYEANLTLKQSKILAFCVECWEKGEGIPSLRDICAHFSFASTRAAADHLKALKTKGYLDHDHGARRYRLTEKAIGLPVLGGVSAGIATAETEQTGIWIPLNTRVFGIEKRSNAFLLRVCGDSMIGRHIFNGDIVLMEKMDFFKNNDIVVALIDNESTLKTLIKENGRSWLRSENPDYPDLIPVWDLQIQGVIRASLRFFPS